MCQAGRPSSCQQHLALHRRRGARGGGSECPQVLLIVQPGQTEEGPRSTIRPLLLQCPQGCVFGGGSWLVSSGWAFAGGTKTRLQQSQNHTAGPKPLGLSELYALTVPRMGRERVAWRSGAVSQGSAQERWPQKAWCRGRKLGKGE